MVLLCINAIGQRTTDNVMSIVDNKIFYDGYVYDVKDLSKIFGDNINARMHYSKYEHLHDSAQKKLAWTLTTGAVALFLEVGYQIEREKTKDTGLLILLTGPPLILWKFFSVGMMLTSGTLLIGTLFRKRRARKELSRAVSAFNTELTYGAAQEINLDVQMTGNGVGLVYTF